MKSGGGKETQRKKNVINYRYTLSYNYIYSNLILLQEYTLEKTIERTPLADLRSITGGNTIEPYNGSRWYIDLLPL